MTRGYFLTPSLNLQKKGGGYDIKLDGETIGIISVSKNHIRDIEIFEDERGKGYGTIAIRKLANRMKEKSYGEVTTGAVISSSMERILKKNEFKPEIVKKLGGLEKIRWKKKLD